MKQQTESKTTLRQAQDSALPQFVEVKRAIIYARVSTDEQAETGTSLDNQVEKSLEYIKAYSQQEGIDVKVVGIFREDYSGKILDRPELNKVRAMFRAGQADMLIVYKTNRLDRSEWGVNLLLLLQEIKSLGVELHYSKNRRQVNLDNPVEALMESISGWQAGEDHRETVTKLHEGRRNRAKAGYVVPHGHAPYGYKRVKIDKKWYFEIDETEAEIVQQIFTWYAYDLFSLAEIKRKLKELGVETRGDKKNKNKKQGWAEWSTKVLERMLTSETYIGTWYYGKRGTNGPNDKKQRIGVEVPVIIDSQLWGAVQKRKAQYKHMGNNRVNEYLIGGRVTCGDCGYKMGGTGRIAKSHTRLYYRCPARYKADFTRDCKAPHFRADKVDKIIWDWLTELFTAEDSTKLKDGLLGYQAEMADKVAPIERDLKLVAIQISEFEAELGELILDHKTAMGRRHKARIAANIQTVEDQLDALEKKRNELKRELDQQTVTDEQILYFEEFARQMRQDWHIISKDFDSRRLLIERLNITVRLFVDDDGQKKAAIRGKLTPGEKVLSIEEHSICTPKDQSCREKYRTLSRGCR